LLNILGGEDNIFRNKIKNYAVKIGYLNIETEAFSPNLIQ